jgi:hypothetical protein
VFSKGNGYADESDLDRARLLSDYEQVKEVIEGFERLKRSDKAR